MVSGQVPQLLECINWEKGIIHLNILVINAYSNYNHLHMTVVNPAM